MLQSAQEIDVAVVDAGGPEVWKNRTVNDYTKGIILYQRIEIRG